MNIPDNAPELSPNHPLSSEFDFNSFAKKNKDSILKLKEDAEVLSSMIDESYVLICSAITSDKTSISKEDIPLPVPTEEPFESRFIHFVFNMEKYINCLNLEKIGYLKETEKGFVVTEKGQTMIDGISNGESNENS